MMRPANDVEVLLYRGITDMRKSINGLSILVEQELGLDPFAPRLIAFANRKRDKVKVLYWDRTGFALWYKRLEKARFPWPSRDSDETLQLTGQQLNWLLDGIDIFRVKPHETLRYDSVA